MSSQTALETPVKNAFGVVDATGRLYCTRHGRQASRLACAFLTTLVYEMPQLCASSLLLPLHLHNLHKQREGRTAGGGWGWACVGRGAQLWGAHVQLRLAMQRDKYGSMRGTHATAGFDDYVLRHPYDMLIDSRKTPPLLCIYEAKWNIDATGTRQRV